MAGQVYSNADTHLSEALRALRRMLVVVSLFAFAVVCVLVWHFYTYRAKLKDLDQQVQDQGLKIANARQEIAQYCDGLAIREFEVERRADAAAQQLDKCMGEFPKDETLPAYKARIYVTDFASDHKKTDDLENAIQAAQLSNKLKPNEDAYEWQGLAYCLQAAYGPSATRQAAGQSAVDSFRQEFTLAPFRKSSITGLKQFQDFCSPELQQAALNGPPVAGH
jgi:hypothetical protein